MLEMGAFVGGIAFARTSIFHAVGALGYLEYQPAGRCAVRYSWLERKMSNGRIQG